MVVDTFVPNDARVTGGDGRFSMFRNSSGTDKELDEDGLKSWNTILLCTGANACGKVRVNTFPPEECLLTQGLECVSQAGKIPLPRSSRSIAE